MLISPETSAVNIFVWQEDAEKWEALDGPLRGPLRPRLSVSRAPQIPSYRIARFTRLSVRLLLYTNITVKWSLESRGGPQT